MNFEIVSALDQVQTIAKGKGIRGLRHLMAKHGIGRWKKMKGEADICFQNGTQARAELHWYEAHGVGKRDFKIKRIIARTG